MTFTEMMTHCKAGGKARRTSWTSNYRVFIEGLRLGVTSESLTSEYCATMQDKAAVDWEAA